MTMKISESFLDKLKPFLKENVESRFKELSGWQDLVLAVDDKVLVLTATGDEGGYFNVQHKTPDWFKKPTAAADLLPTVEPLEGKSFLMRNGEMTGPLTSKAYGGVKALGFFVDTNDGNWTHSWLASGQLKTKFAPSEISEFDLVEMVQSKIL